MCHDNWQIIFFSMSAVLWFGLYYDYLSSSQHLVLSSDTGNFFHIILKRYGCSWKIWRIEVFQRKWDKISNDWTSVSPKIWRKVPHLQKSYIVRCLVSLGRLSPCQSCNSMFFLNVQIVCLFFIDMRDCIDWSCSITVFLRTLKNVEGRNVRSVV